MGVRGWKGRNKPTRFCTNDADVKINNSSRTRRIWLKRRESQMRLTLGIVNALSTLQNIISPLLPPRYSSKPNKFAWKRPFLRSQQRQGFVHGRASRLSPAPPAAARWQARLGGRAAAEWSGELRLPSGSEGAPHSATGSWTAAAVPPLAGSALPAPLP